MNNRSHQAGFIQLIILIVITLFVMKYFGWSVTDLINWFRVTFADVLR